MAPNLQRQGNTRIVSPVDSRRAMGINIPGLSMSMTGFFEAAHR